MDFPPPGVRVARLAEAVEIVIEPSARRGDPARWTVASTAHRRRINRPTAMQEPRPPVFVGGKGDRLIQLAVERADGWNTCWVWTPAAYRERLDVMNAALRSARPRPGDGVALARPLRALSARTRRTSCGDSSACAPTPRRGARRDDPRGVAGRAPGRHGRPGAGAGRDLGRPRRRDPHPRCRRGAVPRRLADDIDLLAAALGVQGSPNAD